MGRKSLIICSQNKLLQFAANMRSRKNVKLLQPIFFPWTSVPLPSSYLLNSAILHCVHSPYIFMNSLTSSFYCSAVLFHYHLTYVFMEVMHRKLPPPPPSAPFSKVDDMLITSWRSTALLLFLVSSIWDNPSFAETWWLDASRTQVSLQRRPVSTYGWEKGE